MCNVWEIEQLHTGFRWEGLRETDHLVCPGVDGRIILKRIFKKWSRVECIRLNWLRIGTGVLSACERRNELSGSMKCGEFLEYLKTC